MTIPPSRPVWHLGLVWFLCAVCAMLPARAQIGDAQMTSAETDLVGPLVLREENIDQVLVLLERLTGKTVLRPAALPAGPFSLSLNDTVSKATAARAIEALLALNGVAVSTFDDRFLKVLPVANAKGEAVEMVGGSTLDLPPSVRLLSKIFHLRFLQATEFAPQIASLLSQGSGNPPVVFDKANALLLTDSLPNLQRAETLIAQLDQPEVAGLQCRFYPVRFAKAGEVVDRMRTILTGAMQIKLGSATHYSADERSNQIVLVADPRQHPFFDDLIARLDVKSSKDTRNEVIYLKHTLAKDMASLLSLLVAGQADATKAGGPSSADFVPAAPSTLSAKPEPPATATIGAAGLAISGSSGAKQFSPLLTILPEARSNALMVSGTEDDIRLISEIVAQFDIVLAQVRIEVVITEVSLGENATSGISALGLQVEGDRLTGFAGNTAGLSITGGTITRPGVVGSGPLDLAAVVALGTTPRKSVANILSVPSIVTSHGKEGKIFVGEQRPVISSYLNDGAAVGGGGTIGTGYRSTVSFQDIGIELSVKPLIGADGSVQLEIKQEVNDVLGEITIDGNAQPRIGRRSTESFVTAQSGEIIVLGGLQRRSQSHSASRLGPLPILGDLFGARSREKSRTDLVILLRPVVLSAPGHRHAEVSTVAEHEIKPPATGAEQPGT